MAQIGKPRGLIDYCTLDDAEVEKSGGQGNPILKTLFRPRTLVYFGIWVSIGLAMLFTLGQRTRLDLSVQQDRNPVYVRLSDGSIRNNYTLKIRNMETRPRVVDVSIAGLPGAVVWNAEGSRESAGQSINFPVAADSVAKLRLFIVAPANGPEHAEFTISTRPRTGDEHGDSDHVMFERPDSETEESE
jgi:polyferredoxin